MAEDLASAEANTDTNPTEAQAEAGNYRKGHFTLHGLPISIENPKGSSRSGTSKDGKKWSVTMAHTYGYIGGTEARDSDHIDCFIGPHPDSEIVFVVDQVTPGGRFDEHKVMFGFDSEEDARAGYLANYEDGWQGLGNLTAMTVKQFKTWLNQGDTLRRLNGQTIKLSDVPVYQRALSAQLREPLWSPQQSLLGNLWNNASAAHNRGQEMINQSHRAQSLTQSVYSPEDWQKLRDLFAGRSSSQPGLTNPVDQVLFKP